MIRKCGTRIIIRITRKRAPKNRLPAIRMIPARITRSGKKASADQVPR
jgi:hypothetical protein